MCDSVVDSLGYRIDLNGWVCIKCYEDLGPDQVTHKEMII